MALLLKKKIPMIVVLGATGTGKSKLGIELASKFNGEIISADSMQVYKGLDIITNKVTKDEQSIVKHHLIDFLNPLSRYTVQDFQNAAMPLVKKIQKANKVPVIVGGTNYYIESILWNVLVNTDEVSSDELLFERDKKMYGEDHYDISTKKKVKRGRDNSDSSENESTQEHSKKRPRFWAETTVSTEELYKTLGEVDPLMKEKYHPNDRRKIIRSLQVWEKTGKPHSKILEEQANENGGSFLGGALRYPDAIVFCINCEQEVLNKRLDDRVDKMLELGLLKELEDFHETFNKSLLDDQSENTDDVQQRIVDKKLSHYSKGIFQSIGFKEFHNYLILPPEVKSTEKGQQLYNEGIKKLKQVTQKYSKRQMKWINNRILLCKDRQVPKVFSLDGTSVDDWDDRVRLPAEGVIDAILKGGPSPLEPFKANDTRFSKNYSEEEKRAKFECETCNMIIIGKIQWEDHLKGRKHRKTLQSISKLNNTSNPNKIKK